MPDVETYAELPRRSVSRAAAFTMLVGCVLLLIGLGLATPRSQRTTFLAVTMRPVTALRTAAGMAPATARPSMRLRAETEEESETIGDLLRGGGKSAVSLKPSSLADALAQDAKEEAARRARAGIKVDEPDVEIPPSPWTNTESLVVDEEQTISRISFGVIGITTGVSLLVYGFGAYFQLLPGESASAVMLIYGFPASLIGFALKYAELKPLICKSDPEALKMRETQATDIQKRIREDVTRYRYGDEQHLEEAIDRIFKLGRPDGIARNSAPKMTGISEQVIDGEYALVLEFKNDDRVPMRQWANRADKFTTFFGPGIRAELGKTEQGVDVALICDGSGAGREGKEQGDVLPPLMPGMPARRVD
jgi:hypothetical protein